MFNRLDAFLIKQKGQIIHQIWFGTIPNQKEATICYEKLKIFRNSWRQKNPDWFIMEWDWEKCFSLIKTYYPEHIELFKNYRYDIQRCDAVRYLILHRYGGWYADMDYYCNKPLNNALNVFKGSVLIVQTPNTVIGQGNDFVSNSLMYSIPKHPFWRQIMIELEKSGEISNYYGKHITVMFSTGPGIINRTYALYKNKYDVKSLPWKLFHPYGIKDQVRILSLPDTIYTAHISKSSWSENDTHFFNTILREWKILLFIGIIFIFQIYIVK